MIFKWISMYAKKGENIWAWKSLLHCNNLNKLNKILMLINKTFWKCLLLYYIGLVFVNRQVLISRCKFEYINHNIIHVQNFNHTNMVWDEVCIHAFIKVLQFVNNMVWRNANFLIIYLPYIYFEIGLENALFPGS